MQASIHSMDTIAYYKAQAVAQRNASLATAVASSVRSVDSVSHMPVSHSGQLIHRQVNVHHAHTLPQVNYLKVSREL